MPAQTPVCFEHLQVVFGTRAQALSLEQFALGGERRQLLLKFCPRYGMARCKVAALAA
jgi:hypothetical protein